MSRVLMLFIICCGVAAGALSAARLHARYAAQPPSSASTTPAFLFGTIRTLNTTNGLLTLDRNDPYPEDGPAQIIQVRFDKRTSFFTLPRVEENGVTETARPFLFSDLTLHAHDRKASVTIEQNTTASIRASAILFFP